MFQITDLVKQYGSPPQNVLNHVNLSIPTGSVFGLLGPNGAGKTTLISILVGLVPKTSGTVLFDGVDLQQRIAAVRNAIGLVPQDLAFYPMLSGWENLRFFAGALGIDNLEQKQRLEFCIETAGLQQYIHKRAQYYSGGLKRRLNLAIGLLNQPKVLCLDEPTVGIDPQSRNFILETITELNRKGTTVIYTSHYMEEVEQICDQVAIIDHGTILIQGQTNDLLHNRDEAELRVQFCQEMPPTLREQLQMRFDIMVNEAKHITIKTDHPAQVLSELAPQLEANAVEIERIHFGFKNLEELFLSLTSKQLRDSLDG
ncbi:ABC transporter ATP-binding protein [Kaarinaea lacus]